MNRSLVVLCCSVLRRELEVVLQHGCPQADLIFIDSMLHMHPQKLYQTMEAILSRKANSACLIVYGDCHAYMQQIERQPQRVRTHGANCAELLLGQEAYKKYRNAKAFLFLPEWTRRWREVFQQELGFSDPSLAKEFMQENRNSLVYLDTGVASVPRQELQEITAFFEMPVSIVTIPLVHLQRSVESAMERLEGITGHGS